MAEASREGAGEELPEGAAEHNVEVAETEYRKVVSVLDKVSSTSTMHRNTAARRKSRLARRLNMLKTAAA